MGVPDYSWVMVKDRYICRRSMNDTCVCPGVTCQDAVNILPPAGRLAQQTGYVMDSTQTALK